MMKMILVALQFFLLKKGMDKTQSSILQLEKVVTYIKRFALFFLGIFFSVLFMITAMIVAVVDIGLQLARNGNVSMEGLMWSSLIFAGISILFAVVSFIYLSMQNKTTPAPQYEETHRPSTEWADIADKLLQAFLNRPNKDYSEKRRTDSGN